MLATLLLTGTLALAQAPAPEPAPAPEADLATTVRQLVRQLDDPKKPRRDEAEKLLVEMGTKILDVLPEPDKRTPAEVTLRLARIRSQLESTQAEAAVLASSVTLAAHEIPLSQIMADIGKQTGNKLVDFREQFNQELTDPKLDITLDQVPFWSAFDQVLDLAGLTIYNFADDQGLAYVTRSETQLARHGRAAYSGSFRIDAGEFSALRDLRDPSNDSLQLTLEAAWEPRLQPIVIVQPPDSIAATDENGQPIPISAAMGEQEIEINPGAKSVDFPVQFARPERGVQRVASLKGKFSALLPGRVESFRFKELTKAKKVEQRKGGVTVVVDEVRRNNAVWEVRVRVVFEEAGGALESHRGWVFNNEAFLEDRDGEPIPHAGYETTRQTKSEVGVAYLFDLPDGPKGMTFVYKTPAAIVGVPLEFELKDLELP